MEDSWILGKGERKLGKEKEEGRRGVLGGS